MTESQLQQMVIDLARWAGYLAYHTHDSRRSAAGFPDLVLVHVRTGRLVIAELKSDIGKPTPAQVAWLDALRAGGHAVYLWRPDDWTSGAIRQVLNRTAMAA